MKKILFNLLIFLFSLNSYSQDCSDLFISEYIEGPINNNAIEIYNPTATTIDLSNYSIKRYGNGSITSSDSWPLSGFIASGQAIVIGNGQVDSVLSYGLWYMWHRA